MVPEVLPIDLKRELVADNPPTLIDVREADELEICRLPGAIHIPLGQLPSRLSELDAETNYVVFCHLGGRSARATAFLLESGFKNVRNLVTGIRGWAESVDPNLPKY